MIDRLPQWFRVVTGLVELIGGALLIIGYWQKDFVMAGVLKASAANAIGPTIKYRKYRFRVDAEYAAVPVSQLR